jgi:hypothetical protein
MDRLYQPDGPDLRSVAHEWGHEPRGNPVEGDRRRHHRPRQCILFLPHGAEGALRAQLKLVTGYRGGNDVNLAMERGEVGGRVTTWSNWKVVHPSWFANELVRVLAYAGPRPKDLPDIPALEDVVPTPEDREVVRLLMSGAQLGRPLAAPPGVSPERVSAVRSAFHQTITDPAFVKEATAINIEIDPVSGDEMQRVVSGALGTPAALRERAFRLLE